MVYRCVYYLAIMIGTASCSQSGTANSDYDRICDYVQSVLVMDVSEQQKFDYIGEYFDNKVKSKDAKEAYVLIYQIAPDQRYSVFKGAVEASTGTTWECPALDTLFDLRK